MKKLLIFFGVIAIPCFLFAQTIIWQEDFNKQVGKGVSGDGNGGVITDLTNVNWTLDYSDCLFAATNHFVKVDSYFSGGRFEARNCNGEAIWESNAINISNYENIQITVKTGETGSSNNTKAKYIRLYSITDGTETLFSINGKGLGNFGSATASTSISMGNTLKIRIKIRSDLAQDVYFDDIKVVGTPTTPTSNDTDSQILSAGGPVGDQKVVTAEAAARVQEVFRFKIVDKGTADGKSTNLTKVVLKKAEKNTLNWANEIAVAVLKSGTASATATVTADAITFTIPENKMSIADNTSRDFTVLLKTTPTLAEGTKFQTQIEAVHGFTASNTGSTLATPLAAPIVSDITIFTIKATALRFKTQPSDTQVRTNITPPIEVEAIDKNGNLDKDYTEAVTLTAATISGTTTVSAVKGLASFDAAQFTNAASGVIITANSGTLNSVESTAFDVTDITDKNSDIENSDTPITNVIIPSTAHKLTDAVAFFRFKIIDKGSADKKPTQPTQFTIFPAAGNTATWTTTIEGITLSEGTVDNLSITDNKIKLDISGISVANGKSQEVTLNIFLKKEVIDGTKLQFEIPTTDSHENKADIRGSSFSSKLTGATSAIATIEAVATQLRFSKQPPETIAKNTAFDVEVAAVDACGNIDKDYTTAILLTAANLAGTTSATATAGLAIFRDLKVTAPNPTIKLKAISGKLTAESNSFEVSDVVNGSSVIENTTAPSTTAISPNETKAVFSFAIVDKAGDNYPTKVSQLVIVPGVSNQLNWGEVLKVASLQAEGKKLPATVEITKRGIVFRFSKEVLTVAEGTMCQLTLHVQLAASEIQEGKILAFQIPASNHLAVASESASSYFATDFPTAIISKQIRIQIKATKLIVISFPNKETAGIQLSSPIVAQLQDAYGNIDTDSMHTATLYVQSGTGTLSPTSSLSQSLTNGTYTWQQLTYNRAEKATFKIQAGKLFSESFTISFSTSHSSLILQSENPIQNDTILSLRNTRKQLKDFFKFTVKDLGDDGLPTQITSIRLVKGPNFSLSRLYFLIGGIVVKEGNKIIGAINELNISNGSSVITIPLSKTLEIADATSKELTVSIFLSQHKKLEDGATIQLAIDKEHNWTVSDAGTSIRNPLPKQLLSPIFTVDIVATRFVFQKIPKNITSNTPFSVTIAAVDAQGRTDKEYTGTVKLSREAGTGTLRSKSGLSLSLKKGKVTWTDLVYDTGESFTLLATSDTFAPAESTAINANDADSELQIASTPISNGSIASTVANETAAQNVFAFALQDKGTNDNNPTILTKAVFTNAYPENAANWKANISGAVLLQNGTPVATTEDITNETIVFTNSKGLVSIPNGSTSHFTLAIYLKYNNIEDNKVFQCKIEADATSFKTSSTGSALQKLDKALISNLSTIEVKATQVDFLETPYALSTATATFNVTVGARDANGNIDTDFKQQVTIKVGEKAFSTYFTNGIASFANLNQNGSADFTLRAESSGLQATEQNVVISKITTALQADFEQGTLQDWLATEDWKTSIVNPISGNYSLKHNLINTSGSSKIAHSLGKVSLQAGTTIWRWQMKNGNWNPSSANNFYYVLASETEEFDTSISYVVGVNRSGSDDILTLSKVEQGKVKVLLSSKMKWTENDKAGIEVKLDSKGNWTLAYDNNGGFDNLYTTGITKDNALLSGKLFTGFVFNYATTSRSGLFWVDDVHVYHFSTAPQVTTLKVLSATELEITCNQAMQKKAAEEVKNYTVDNNIEVQEAKLTYAEKIKLTLSCLETDDYELRLKNLQSAAGIFLPDTTLCFSYFAAVKPGDIVLNELMVDHSPSVQLPDFEYIELFNTTQKPIILSNWTITVGNYEKTFPTDTIKPREYVLICSTSAQQALSKYGKIIVLSGLPTLKNTSGTIILKNAERLEIDRVSYEKAWYNDVKKENGGWSLERINPESPSNSRANWAASQDKRGGTPAEKNSVLGIVLDDIPPAISSVLPIGRNKLKIIFTEPIDSLAVKHPHHFFINGLGYTNQIVISEDAKEILLTFKENFEYGKTYEITIKEIIDLFGNVLENATSRFGLPELTLPNEIIINEILFNPVSGNVDYVELYNRSQKTFDLATLFIATRDAKNALKSVYPMSKDSRLIQPKEFVVLTTSSELVTQQYEIKNPAAFLVMRVLPSFPNTEGIVVILNQEGMVVDEFHYTEKMHLSLLAFKQGVSLERINYELPTQDTNNWHSAAQTAGFGTPTYKNSAYNELQEFDTNIHIAPKVFSPNGDGIDDNMQIHYQFDSPGRIANINIFDSNGRLIRTLTRNLTLNTQGVITWDGVNADNERTRTGRYVIFIEILDTKGNVSTYKKSCVLHGLFK